MFQGSFDYGEFPFKEEEEEKEKSKEKFNFWMDKMKLGALKHIKRGKTRNYPKGWLALGWAFTKLGLA